MPQCQSTYDIEFLDSICKRFSIQGQILSVTPLTQGHINKTFNVVYKNGEAIDRYILQYINSYVFKNPKSVMANTALVTGHIKNKLLSVGVDPTRLVLEFFSCRKKNYFVDEIGGFWRVRRNIQNSVSFGNIDDLSVVNEAGKAFGEFQNYLSDFDAGKLNIVIPHFHNTVHRYKRLKRAAKEDVLGRLFEVKSLYDGYFALWATATKMYKMQVAGELPLRVTHNDTKINNVLFDADSKQHLAVIDLDTIMPGLVGFDYGDAIRFTANSSKEDEEDLNKVYLDFDKFTAFSYGFVSQIKATATKRELKTLALGAVTMTVECGVRFLTDYLEGDKYFCIDYSAHNLVRSRCQLKLARNMLENFDKMQKIIDQI